MESNQLAHNATTEGRTQALHLLLSLALRALRWQLARSRGELPVLDLALPSDDLLVR